MTTDFIQLVAHDLRQKPVKRGKNYFFKCPFHGEGKEKTGSLKISNGSNTHNPGFYCFSCNAHGGAVGYFLKRGHTLEDARKLSGAEPGVFIPHAEPLEPPDQPPAPRWQQRAAEFLAYTRKQFSTFAQTRDAEVPFQITHRETGEKIVKRLVPIEWWVDRGLSVSTGEDWGIGYNPKDIYDTRENWGLPPDPEKPRIWIPQGFVIPCKVGDSIWYIKIRRPRGDPKFIHIPGSVPALYMAEHLEWYDTVIFTEGEFDALLLWQEACVVAGAATLGAATERLNVATWGLHLLYPKQRFTAYDLDSAGKQGADELARFRFQRLDVPKVRAFDKDITDYHLSTGRLKEWVIDQLSQKA